MNNTETSEKADNFSGTLTDDERWWLTIIRVNKALPKRAYIDRTFRIGKVKTHIQWRSSKNLWGRFGGGWNWHIGVEWSKTSIIIFLLVMSIRISWYQKEKP